MAHSSSNQPTITADTLIIGAGISGLVLANQLADAGQTVALVDKGRGVGGRLATRRHTLANHQQAKWDHGAQYFTVQQPDSQALIQPWLDNGWLTPWEALSTDEHPRYIVPNGMTQLCKHLASRLTHTLANAPATNQPPVYLGERVIKLTQQNDYWQATTEADTVFQATHIVITAPVPQTRELLNNSQLELTTEETDCLNHISYAPCIGLLAVTDNPPFTHHTWNEHPVLSWAANNHSKGISQANNALTIHANAAWSAEHFEADDDQNITALKQAAEEELGITHWHHAELKKWRYAQVIQSASQPFTQLGHQSSLWAAGDGFVAGKVEGAIQSALALSRHLTNAAGSP
jgi:hypothetical protein